MLIFLLVLCVLCTKCMGINKCFRGNDNLIQMKFNHSSCNSTITDLLPHISNGLIGTTLLGDSLYISGVYIQEVEWLEAVCLQFPKVGKFINPQGQYELSGLCNRIDEMIQKYGLDFIEKGKGSRRARIDAPFPYYAISSSLNEEEELQMYLNLERMQSGVMTSQDQEENQSVFIQTKQYAHRLYENILVFSLTIDNTKRSTKEKISLIEYSQMNKKKYPLPIDFNFIPITTPSSLMNNLTCYEGEVKREEINDDSRILERRNKTIVGYCKTNVPSEVTVQGGEKLNLIFLASYHKGQGGALIASKEIEALLEKKENQLEEEHLNEVMSNVYDGCIYIEGDNDLNTQIQSSVYNLKSSVRIPSLLNFDNSFPPSPGGLTTNGYFGNIFWDSDVWISLSYLPFSIESAKVAIQYRFTRMYEAMEHASENHFKGCFFPWQSGFSGIDVSLAPCANKLEIHTSAGIVMLIRQIFLANNDLEWMEKIGFPITSCVSDFYVSRITETKSWNGSFKYNLNHVVGPDEFATGFLYSGVQNNVYTNAIVKQVLRFAQQMGELLNHTIPDSYSKIASSLPVLIDEVNNYHPEYEGFTLNKNNAITSSGKVKQADVTMLLHPIIDYTYENNEIMYNDLNIYEKLYDINGPAMTHSISVIGHLETNLRDTSKVYESMRLQSRNIQEPFHIWTETVDPLNHPSDMGCFNFLTGAGGYLTSIYAFFGLRYRDGYVRIAPKLMTSPSSLSMSLYGLKYMGREIDIIIYRNETISFEITKGFDLLLNDETNNIDNHVLSLGEEKKFSFQFSKTEFRLSNFPSKGKFFTT